LFVIVKLGLKLEGVYVALRCGKQGYN